MAALFPYIGSVFCCIGGLLLNIRIRPVFKLIGLAVTYLGAGVLLLNVCSLQICTALFICGIGSSVMLGSVQVKKGDETDSSLIWMIFLLLLAFISGILSYTILEIVRYWIPVHPTILFSTFWIGLMSLFNLSVDDEIFSRCISLQSLCMAFSLCYIYMENSILVFASLAAINLLLALGGSILIMGVTDISEDPEDIA